MDNLLAGSQGLQLEKIVQQNDAVALFVTSTQTVLTCPSCQGTSCEPHSRYERNVADLPWASITVQLRLRVRKFFC